MCKELGINLTNNSLNSRGNDVYAHDDKSEDQLINEHKGILKKYGLEIDLESGCLPKLFAIPKLHKNPYKFRFIAGAHSSSFKPASKLLLGILKFMHNHLRNYCRKVWINNKTNLFWSIENSQQALNMIHNASVVSGINSFTVGDFSTLYTALPHTVILENIFYLIDFCFKNAGADYLTIIINTKGDIYRMWYTHNISVSNPNHRIFHKNDIKSLVHDNINNSYIKFAGIIFRQTIGIPMGANMSPKLADLTLSIMEFKYLKNIKNINKNSDFNFAVRYIDDILKINDPEFSNTCKSIYDSSLEINFSADNSNKCDYLDLHLEIKNELFISVFNKVKDFSFKVHRFGYPDSNIPHAIYYHVFGSQMLRYARICNHIEHFTEIVRELKILYTSRGFSILRLMEVFMKTYNRYPGVFGKLDLIDQVHVIAFCGRVFS